MQGFASLIRRTSNTLCPLTPTLFAASVSAPWACLAQLSIITRAFTVVLEFPSTAFPQSVRAVCFSCAFFARLVGLTGRHALSTATIAAISSRTTARRSLPAS